MHNNYLDILKIGCQLEYALNDAMILCQSWGYNGHKRLYRYYNKRFHCYLIGIENEMYDDHFIVAPLQNESYPAYQPADIKEHSAKWLATLKDACKKLATNNVALVQATGKQSCHVKCLLKDVYKLKEKAHRFWQRGENVEWMAHDLHRQDDVLHDKMKAKEGDK